MAETVTGLVGFARALRHSGMAVGPNRVQSFLSAVEQVGVEEREGVYWAGRLTLCSEPDDVARYDAAFETWFSSEPMQVEQPGKPVSRPAKIAALTAEGRISAWVLGAMPVFLVVVLQTSNPGYLDPMLRGWGLALSAACVVSVVTGIVTIARMVRIEV